MLFSETETAKQNQKFPFHFFFRFAVEGWGEETREKCKEIFWFLHTRVRERVRGALHRFPTQSERTERFRATTRSARAISRQNPADFVRNTFELRPIHTAANRVSEERKDSKVGGAKAPRRGRAKIQQDFMCDRTIPLRNRKTSAEGRFFLGGEEQSA
jgi:hypothetical protein